MKALAAADSPLPTSIVHAVLQLDDAEFHRGISQATSGGLISLTNGHLGIHPLVSEHFWNLLHRENHSAFLAKLAAEVHSFAFETGVGSPQFSLLLPVIVRLYAAAGDWDTARNIRSDLQGELERAAIFHYRRRNYGLAWEYVQHAMQGIHPSWRIRLYEARILIRRERWDEADHILRQLLKERPRDRSVLHAKGWGLLRQGRFEEAISQFALVIAQSEHVASLRDSAECLHRLGRSEESLQFLARAKRVESDNPYVLDLEARIFEERGEFDSAYESAYVAMLRDPNNWAFHHRLGQIRVRQRRVGEAVVHLRRAVSLDQDQFTPLHALAAALLDLGEVVQVDDLVPALTEKASTISNAALLEHLKARVLIGKGETDEGFRLLQREISRRRNLVPNLGLYADTKLKESARLLSEFPALSAVALEEADRAVTRGLQIDKENQFLIEFQRQIAAMRAARQ